MFFFDIAFYPLFSLFFCTSFYLHLLSHPNCSSIFSSLLKGSLLSFHHLHAVGASSSPVCLYCLFVSSSLSLSPSFSIDLLYSIILYFLVPPFVFYFAFIMCYFFLPFSPLSYDVTSFPTSCVPPHLYSYNHLHVSALVFPTHLSHSPSLPSLSFFLRSQLLFPCPLLYSSLLLGV